MENMNTMIMMYTHMYSWMVNSWSSEQPNMSEPNPEMAAQFEKDEAERKAERANQAERKANRNNQNAQGCDHKKKEASELICLQGNKFLNMKREIS